MVDPGEQISITLKREFSEEALALPEMNDEDQKETCAQHVAEYFREGLEVK